uniref:SH3 domain-containing protein n=1 Tax=Panagrolaimus sp. PS1159 TaxID=55785 RepID=A0AC35EXR1_9BILA
RPGGAVTPAINDTIGFACTHACGDTFGAQTCTFWYYMDAYLNSTFSLRDLLEKQIPEELGKLEESANRLEHVAAFAEANYLKSPNKKQVFNETRGWTTQSLAGVAYQVNQLSSMLIRSLDLECENIASKVNEANNISQEIAISNERTARQQIGAFTHSKNVARLNKILYPSRRLEPPRHQFSEIDFSVLDNEIAISNERTARQQIGAFTHSKNVARLNKILYPSRRLKPPRHQFSEIDFSVLDNVGHAVKDVMQRPSVNRTNSILSGSDNMSSYSNQPPYDFLITRGNPNATLSRKSLKSEVYRPSQVPNYADIQRYSTVTSRSNMMSENGSVQYHQSNNTSRATILPPSQLGSVSQYRLSIESNEGLPPPPAALAHPNDEPLPPPPFDHNEGLPPPPAALAHPNDEPLPPPPFDQYQVYGTAEPSTPDWAPANYIEKALAIYDYEAEKEDELNLRENSIVYVVAKNEDGWYEGIMDGMTGLFPSNYVQKI